MPIRDEIIQLISQETDLPVSITEETDLYQDLHLDSLSFVSLLMDIEEQFGVTLELPEMQCCLVVGQMIKLVETKTRGTQP